MSVACEILDTLEMDAKLSYEGKWAGDTQCSRIRFWFWNGKRVHLFRGQKQHLLRGPAPCCVPLAGASAHEVDSVSFSQAILSSELVSGLHM